MKIGIVGTIHEAGKEILQSHGFKVTNVTDPSPVQLKKELADVSGIVLRTTPMPNEVIDACPQLKIIARHGVGFDNVDLSYITSKKIALGITGTANAVSVAEHVMTFFLQLSKNIHLSDQLTREGNFHNKGNLPSFYELYQKNVLIFGFGRIGQAVAQRCLGFDMRVHVYDPFQDKQTIENLGCIPTTKEVGLQLADYISIHLPLNAETKNFINRDSFQQIKKNCIIVNTARGGIINEDDLVEALQNKTIRAAGLDVFTQEPPSPNHPLFSLSNVLLTPHNAALTLECRKRMAVESCETVAFFLNKNDKLNLSNIVNRKELELY